MQVASGEIGTVVDLQAGGLAGCVFLAMPASAVMLEPQMQPLGQPRDVGCQQQRNPDCQQTRLHAIVCLGWRGRAVKSDSK